MKSITPQLCKMAFGKVNGNVTRFAESFTRPFTVCSTGYENVNHRNTFSREFEVKKKYFWPIRRR
jgi:hypothetical protein